MRQAQLTALIAAMLLCQAAPAAWAASHESVIFSFPGGPGGSYPVGGLLPGPDGSLFGTTGAAPGVAFQLLPPTAGSGWTENILHVFGQANADGNSPAGTLIADATGNLYGVTSYGGAHGHGTVFALSPPAPGQTAWSEAILYSFAGGADGSVPFSTLLQDAAGNLFGTTAGKNITGQKVSTAFELSPPAAAGQPWTHTVIHRFDQKPDGQNAIAGFTAGPDGTLYSVTEYGGTAHLGTAYSLTPPAQPGGPWTEAILYNFQNKKDAHLPAGELTVDAAGALYGTSGTGGAHFVGTVYKLTPPAPGQTQWSETILHSFVQKDGQLPLGKLLMDSSGALTGTTSEAGTYNGGTVFKLFPPAAGTTAWRETVLHQFGATHHDGVGPQSGVISDASGALFGATEFGGTANQGAVYEITK